MQPLLITAYLAVGYGGNPWSPSLDGILAYFTMAERVGYDAMAITDDRSMEPVEGLPLAIERHGDWWWYRCSSPIVPAATQEHSHYHHRRFRDTHAETYLHLPNGRILTSAGPYKGCRRRDVVTITPTVQWHVIGDHDNVERLLKQCHHIGSARSRGHGRVLRWEIMTEGDPDLAQYYRPLPEGYAAEHNIIGEQRTWGIRPPARIPANQAPCIMPEPR